jgi:hypothetical protein
LAVFGVQANANRVFAFDEQVSTDREGEGAPIDGGCHIDLARVVHGILESFNLDTRGYAPLHEHIARHHLSVVEGVDGNGHTLLWGA